MDPCKIGDVIPKSSQLSLSFKSLQLYSLHSDQIRRHHPPIAMKHGKVGKERFEAQPPPIALVPRKVPEDKEKGHYLKLDLKTSPGVRTSDTYQAQVKIFKNGTLKSF